MKCREYIFKLTSGQLKEADLLVRLDAAQHRLRCRYCRAFTRNDAALDEILAEHRERLTQPESPQREDGPGQTS